MHINSTTYNSSYNQQQNTSHFYYKQHLHILSLRAHKTQRILLNLSIYAPYVNIQLFDNAVSQRNLPHAMHTAENCIHSCKLYTFLYYFNSWLTVPLQFFCRFHAFLVNIFFGCISALSASYALMSLVINVADRLHVAVATHETQ